MSADNSRESVIMSAACFEISADDFNFGVDTKIVSVSCWTCLTKSVSASRIGAKLLSDSASHSTDGDSGEATHFFISEIYETKMSTSASSKRVSTWVLKTAGDEGDGASNGGCPLFSIRSCLAMIDGRTHELESTPEPDPEAGGGGVAQKSLRG